MTKKLFGMCLVLASIGAVGEAGWSSVVAFERLTDAQEMATQGGQGIYQVTATECEMSSSIKCPQDDQHITMGCPIGTNQGDPCPGTEWCLDITFEEYCSGPYNTYFWFDRDCQWLDDYECHVKVWYCDGGVCNVQQPSEPGAAFCGEVAQCRY
jgi:hypothetical protein